MSRCGSKPPDEAAAVGAQATTLDAAVPHRSGQSPSGATFSSQRLSYNRFGQVGEGEEYEDNSPANGSFDPATECYEDENGNGSWDANSGLTGQGGASDAVLYEMTVSYPRLFPTPKLLGWPARNIVKASTVLRNQPYGPQANPSVTRCPA